MPLREEDRFKEIVTGKPDTPVFNAVKRGVQSTPSLVKDTAQTVRDQGVLGTAGSGAMNLVGTVGRGVVNFGDKVSEVGLDVAFGEGTSDKYRQWVREKLGGAKPAARPEPVIREDRLNKQINENFAQARPAGLSGANVITDNDLSFDSVFGPERTTPGQRPLNAHGKPVQSGFIANNVPGYTVDKFNKDGSSVGVIPWDEKSDPAYLGHTLTGDQHRDYLLKRGLMKSQADLQTEAAEAAGDGEGSSGITINIPNATGLDSRRLDLAEKLSEREFLKNQLDLEKIDVHKLGRFGPKFNEFGEQTGTEKVGEYLVGTDQRGNQVSIGDDDDFGEIPVQQRRYANEMLKRIQAGDYSPEQRSALLQRLMAELGYESLRR